MTQIYQRKYTLDFFDTDQGFNMTYQAMARLLQGMATTHSEQLGVGYQHLAPMDRVWLLHRLSMAVERFPRRHDRVVLSTWVRGFQRFKSFREYLITDETGAVLARGAAVWLFFDTRKKRIAKAPEAVTGRYTPHPESVFDADPHDWPPCGKITPELSTEISLRYSDFDINGHVNNTQYIGFLETLCHLEQGGSPIQEIHICYKREIDPGRRRIQAGWVADSGAYLCNIRDNDTLFAEARIITVPAPTA